MMSHVACVNGSFTCCHSIGLINQWDKWCINNVLLRESCLPLAQVWKTTMKILIWETFEMFDYCTHPCCSRYLFLFVGTPPRITRDTIDFSKCDIKRGDDNPIPFSFMSERVKVHVSQIIYSACHCILQSLLCEIRAYLERNKVIITKKWKQVFFS